MNSQMKEALSEFISGNTSAIDQAIENGNHGKDEPVIPDLVNYLSCPTPQPCTKDGQTMAMDESPHKPSFNSTNLEATELAHFNSPQFQDTPNNNQYNIGQMCVSNADTPLNLLSPNYEGQERFSQHFDSYGPNVPMYQDPVKHESSANRDFQDGRLGGSSNCENTESQSSAIVVSTQSQFFHNGQPDSFQCPIGNDRNYHQTLEAHFSNSNSDIGKFQNNSLPTENSFDGTSVLSSLLANSEVRYGSTQDNLRYSLVNVMQATVSDFEPGADQLKAQDKMHVDEPEVTFNCADNSTTSSNQAAILNTIETHLQSYNPEGFIVQSTSITNNELSDGGLKQSLTNNTMSQSPNVSEASSSATQAAAAFGMNGSSYQSPLPSPFINQNASLNMASSPEPATPDFPAQQSPCQINSLNSDSNHYISLHPGSADFSRSSSSSASQFSYSPNHPSPYQGSQYQDSPVQSQSSPSIPNNFHLSSANTPTSVPGFSHDHSSFESALYHQSHGSHPSSLLDHKQFQQSPDGGSDRCSDVCGVHAPDQHSAGYQSNIVSPMGSSASFSPSAPSGDVSQKQQSYLINSVHPSSSQANNPSDFIDYSSNQGPVLSSNNTSVNHVPSSQSVTDYGALAHSNQGQALTESMKTSSDVAMGEFSCGGNLGSFSQIDLDTVVSNFNMNETCSSNPLDASNMDSSLNPPSYGGYDTATSSTNFQQAPNMAAEVKTQFSFSQKDHSVAAIDSYVPAVSTTNFVPATYDLSTGHQFETSNFGQQSSPQSVSENFPQPMQVQDTDFANKVPQPSTTYPYHAPITDEQSVNTETAMDVTSSVGDKNTILPSSISFEEIHMSIVKAGDALSKDLSGTNTVYDNSLAITSHAETCCSNSALYSNQTSGIFQTGASLSGGIVSYSTSSGASLPEVEAVKHQSILNTDPVAAYVPANSALSPTQMSNVNADHNIISSILNNIQVSSVASSQLIFQEQIYTQPNIKVPNFLENPGTSTLCKNVCNQDSFMPSMDGAQSQSQTRLIVSMMTDTADSSRTVIEGSGIDQSKMNDVITSKQQHILNSGVSVMSDSPHIFDCIKSLEQAQSSTFLGQSTQISGAANSLQINQIKPDMNLNGVRSSGPDSVPPSGIFLQLDSSDSDSKNSGLQNAVSDSINVTSHLFQGPKSSVGGLSSADDSAGNPTPVLTSCHTNQPQIIVSLEDLQKLLAQQNLSNPSHHQQTHAALSSPQTLVLHKHASHSLRQSQPRLLIRGATLPGSARIIHTQQQVQHARDRLQLLVHQTQPAENISTGSSTLRNLDQGVISTTQENQQKFTSSFQLPRISHQDQQPAQQRLQLPQQAQTFEQLPQQPKIQLHLKQTQGSQQPVNLFLQQIPKLSDQKLASLQLVLTNSQQQSQTDHKHGGQSEPQSGHHSQQAQNVIPLAQMQQELQLLQKQQEKEQEMKEQQSQQHLQVTETPERTERPCSDSLKKDYKHLHSLLTGETAGVSGQAANMQTKALPSVLNLPSGSQQGQSYMQLLNGLSGNLSNGASSLTTPFSFQPVNSFSSLQVTNSNLASTSAPLTTLAFLKTFTTSTVSQSFDSRNGTVSTNPQTNSLQSQSSVKTEEDPDRYESDTGRDSSLNRQASILAQILTDRKRCHTPLSVDLNSSANSGSEAGSPLSSPTVFEDGNTQLTLIERSADLHIKSDTMHSLNDDDDENASFDLNAFHKRPSADESHKTRETIENVPMKIAKPSLNADAHSSINPPLTPEATFDFGSAISSASNFFFSFGNKEDNNSEVFTFGSFGTGTSMCDSMQYKDGSKHYKPSNSKPTAKAVGMRSSVPTQSVRPTSRKQKEYSLKAYYPSKVDTMELKILEQPEPQHRARYQTEGSRGAIKDASQHGFPIIKLFGYNKATKLQVFIGDECSRVKPHGFYQACRVFGKNSTACVEQEIEGTTVIEIEMVPENDMTVKLDCIGILKLRNADVERRIGPKRARDKKKTNTRARVVMRCLVEKADGNQHLLQVVSNPIICTQPVGQPEISRMSLSESSAHGGESLFIIGKNFRNKGTSVLFQKLDCANDSVLWQAEAEIEQEFFQPTHLICKIPAYKDKSIDMPHAVQIVIISAGKKSDPQHFIYKPVCPVVPSVKQEIPMETDITASARPLPFVSPEALHLNRMVQQTHAQSSSMFQLPPGTVPAIHAAKVKPLPATASSNIIRPAKLTNLSPSQVDVPTMSPNITLESSMSVATSVLSEPFNSSFTGQEGASFLLEKTENGLAQKLSAATVIPAAITDGAKINCIVRSNSNTNAISPMSYAISDSHKQTSLTTSSGSGHTVCTDSQSSVPSRFPSKPFFVVVDPSALQTSVGGDKIQQLLQQILEAQSRV